MGCMEEEEEAVSIQRTTISLPAVVKHTCNISYNYSLPCASLPT